MGNVLVRPASCTDDGGATVAAGLCLDPVLGSQVFQTVLITLDSPLRQFADGPAVAVARHRGEQIPETDLGRH